MDYPETFSKELFSAFDAKLAWYDEEELPRLLSEYRKLHAYVENLINTLLNKGSIHEDPYKHDKKYLTFLKLMTVFTTKMSVTW